MIVFAFLSNHFMEYTTIDISRSHGSKPAARGHADALVAAPQIKSSVGIDASFRWRHRYVVFEANDFKERCPGGRGLGFYFFIVFIS